MGVGGQMQGTYQQQQQQQQFMKQQQMMMQQRQMQMPPNYLPPYPQQRARAPMGGFPGGFPQDQQYALQHGLKPPNNQQGGVLQSSLQQQGQMNQNVMGPPTPHNSMQQHVMQSVRSPPPIKSPQPTPSPRAAPSPRAQPSASPRAQPSPHHLPSHSPAPQQGGPDMHNHMHPHQSPASNDNMGPTNDGVQLTAQDQLTKFVEQL